MPADASGVTTDDQGRPHNQGGDAPAGDGGGGGGTDRSAGDRAPGDKARALRPGTGAGGGDGSSPAGDPNGWPPPEPAVPGEGADVGTGTAATGDAPTDETAPMGDTTDTTDRFEADRGAIATDPAAPGLAPGAEPPPAPVLTSPGQQQGRARRVAARHLARRRDRASRRGLRVDQRLWTIDPWSVFKVSALFYLCLGLVIVVAGTLLYNAGRSIGTIEQLESFVTRMGAYGECVPQAEVPEGTEFRSDDDKCAEGEVLVGGFTLDDGTLFRAGAGAVAVLVVAGAIGNVLLVVLLNLLNELTGGLRHTVIKEPVSRPARGGQGPPGARAAQPARRRSGSPPPPPEG
ncbi:MAG TPA: DUF3566 domain-containing protein [Acidimicrobiales bacterium]